MRIIWTVSALRDLAEIREYIETISPVAAPEVASKILDAVGRLEADPRTGRPGRIPGTRELVVAHSPYLIPYRIRGSAIELLRVLHGRRKWPENFG